MNGYVYVTVPATAIFMSLVQQDLFNKVDYAATDSILR